jgi:ribonuclease P protein component
MAGGTVSRTPHFVLHRASFPEPPVSADPAAPAGPPDALGSRLRGNDGKGLFGVRNEPWIGAVVPKRWAKRAVTRNGIKRQIYSVSASFASRLPAAAHVVRLRTDFARAQFPSAWSDTLKASVHGELLQLFEQVVRQRVIPAQAGRHQDVIPAPAGMQGKP